MADDVHALLPQPHRTWTRPESAALAQRQGLVATNPAAVAESHARTRQAPREAP